MCRFGGGDDASNLGESLVVLHNEMRMSQNHLDLFNEIQRMMNIKTTIF